MQVKISSEIDSLSCVFSAPPLLILYIVAILSSQQVQTILILILTAALILFHEHIIFPELTLYH